MNIILAVNLGAFFGFALYFVGATVNSRILQMLRLEDITLAKIILFAIGFSSVLLSISAMANFLDITHIHIKSMNLGVIIGGLIFGIGFGSAGTCPGTCVGAVGGLNNIKRALAAVIGGLFGAFIYSLSYGYFVKKGLFNVLNYGKITLFNISPQYDSVFNFGYTGLLAVGILFMTGAYFMPKKILK